MSKQRIVVTGASRGLGFAMCEGFIARGHTVLGCSRSSAAVDDLSQRFASPHAFHAVDVSDPHAVHNWANRVLADGDPPDLLINNAALINQNARLWETSVDEFSDVVDVNIKGVFHVIRSFAPAMIAAGRGVIVNFSSGWGRSAAPEVAPYCATKWAIEGMTRALADELPSGLAAVAFNPGVIHTEMLDSCFGSGAADFPSPGEWAESAVPFLLDLGPQHNGEPLTAPS